MGTPPTVCVDDDLTTSKTSVTLGATNNEAARGLDLLRVRNCQEGHVVGRTW